MQLYPHLYADDTQIYGFCAPYEVSTLQQRMSVCIDSVRVDAGKSAPAELQQDGSALVRVTTATR